MVLRFEISGHEGSCGAGHSTAATRASVESALRSAHDINAEEITVEALGAYIILEGFVRQRGDVERAVEIAEEVVGAGYVRSRMLRR